MINGLPGEDPDEGPSAPVRADQSPSHQSSKAGNAAPRPTRTRPAPTMPDGIMTEPEEVFQREVLRRHEGPSAPLVGATEPEVIFQQEVLDRHRQPGGRALAHPADAQAVAADRAWLATMMAERTVDGE